MSTCNFSKVSTSVTGARKLLTQLLSLTLEVGNGSEKVSNLTQLYEFWGGRYLHIFILIS